MNSRPRNGQDRDRLSPCVCSTLRMVSRAVTQLYDDVLRPSGLRVTQFSILATIARLGEANLRQLESMLAIDQTTLTRSLNLLERDGLIERASHADARIRAMKLTSKGRRALAAARPLWARAQDKVRSEEHTSELQSLTNLVCRLLLEKKKKKKNKNKTKITHKNKRYT